MRSLSWNGDTLVDWNNGSGHFTLEGAFVQHRYGYGFPFDSAVASPSGRYRALYWRHGTKAVIVRDGELLREINRSYYCSTVHEYPIALLRLKNGREVIAHCPEEYNRLEIDDLETGERLTKSAGRDPQDHFFSRLTVDSQGEFLMSAGWWWHPLDVVNIFPIESGLHDPAVFDGRYENLDTTAENTNAAFMANGQVLTVLSEVWDYGDEEITEHLKQELQPNGVFRIFDPRTCRLVRSSLPQARVGTIMPVGENHVVGFYEHPRLFDLRTGEVVHNWPQIDSGTQMGCIHSKPVPPMALDPRNHRFAVASESEIVIVSIDFEVTGTD